MPTGTSATPASAAPPTPTSSPIRRYPILSRTAPPRRDRRWRGGPLARGLAEVGAHCSERERDATRTERDADSVCASFLLERELFERGPGSRFEGGLGVGAGAFIRFGGTLANVYEGFLPARRIGGRERYELDATETMLVGARGGGRVRTGDPATVIVDRVDAPRGRVDLLPAEGG